MTPRPALDFLPRARLAQFRRFPRTITLGTLACLVLALGLLAPSAAAQATHNYFYGFGRGTYSVPLPVERGYVDASNGNLHLENPIAAMPQRGHVPFVAALVYDSHIWQQVTSGSSTTWQPTNVLNSWGGWRLVTAAAPGSVSYNIDDGSCTDHGIDYPFLVYDQFVWNTADGRQIPFSIATHTGNKCAAALPSGNSIASDASGYHMYVGAYHVATIYAPDGTQVFPNVKDTNGNYFSAPNSNGDVTDTLGRTPITTTTNGNTTTYQVLNSQGSNYPITVTTTTIQVCTSFGQSGATENCSTSTPLTVVQSIGLPDGTSYSFGYDSGTTAGHYGVLTSMTMPTTGQVTYQHTNFKDAYGNQNLFLSQRTAGGGTWTYTPHVVTSCGTSCSQTVTVAKPNGAGGTDTEVHTFTMNQSTGVVFTTAWDMQQDFYTGSSTLLKTVAVTYDFSNPPFIRPLSVTTTLPMPSGPSVKSQIQFVNDTSNLGNVLTRKEWNFYTGSLPTNPDRTINYTYLVNSNNNMVNKKTTVQVTNKAGTQVAYTAITYDGYGANGSLALASMPNVVGHDDTNFGTGYTPRGNPTLIQRYYTSSAHLDTALSFDMTGQVTQAQDPNTNVTQFSYGNNFFTDGSPPQNPPQQYTQAPLTNAYVTTITPPLIPATTLGYYFQSGKLAETTDPNGAATYFHYLDANSWDRFSHQYLPAGGWFYQTYTGETQIDDYTGITTASPTSTCTSASSCRNDRVTLENLGRLQESQLVNDPENADKVDYTYDTSGRIASVTNPYRSTSDSTYGTESPSYDGLNRVTQVTHADSDSVKNYYGAQVTTGGGISAQLCSSGTYGLGYPILGVDEASKKRQTWVDGFGRTIELDEPDGNGSLTSNTCYTYDALNDLTQVTATHGGQTQTRTYNYDQLSRVTSATTPESGTTSFSYTKSGGSLCAGAASAVCSRTDARSITTTYTYDALNRLTSKAYAGGGTTTPAVYYCYDQTGYNGLTITNGKGRRTLMTDSSSCSTVSTTNAAAWSYDAAGRIVTEQRTIATITKTTSYAYNLDGTLASITYPSGRMVTYTTSNAEQATKAVDSNGTQYAVTASYAAAGALNSVIYGQVGGGFGGVTESRAYNSRLEFQSIQASSTNGTALNLGYCFNGFTFANGCSTSAANNNGSVTGIVNNTDSGRTEAVTYDPLNRALSAQSKATSGTDCWGQSFGTDGKAADDPLGNLLAMNSIQCSSGTLSVSVAAATNRINSPTTYTYDAAGNMTNDTLYAYTYDAENRISSAAGVNYTYDGDGLRVEKSSGTLYWRSISGDTIGESNLSGAIQNEYVFFAGRRIAWISSSTVYYVYSDHLGTTRSITDASGHVCYDADYTPYGQEMAHTNTCSQNYKFTGYERDPETGLDYAFARYYNWRTGRFMGADPLGGDATDPQSLNRYAYTGNDPTDFIDPSGLFKWKYPCLSEICLYLTGTSLPFPGYGDMYSSESFCLGPECHWYVIETTVVGNILQTALGAGGVGEAYRGAFRRAVQLALKPGCARFLQTTEQNGILAVAGVSDRSDLTPEEQSLVYDNATPGRIALGAGAAQAVASSADPQPAPGLHTAATTDYFTQSITFYQTFSGLSQTGQAQIILHESLHLFYPLSDPQLAGAAGVPQGGSSAQASANFQTELQKHCK